jgi:hypothetical protein
MDASIFILMKNMTDVMHAGYAHAPTSCAIAVPFEVQLFPDF